MDRYESGQIPAIPVSMVLMVSSPFILLAWLLVSTITSDLERFERIDRALDVFLHGEQLVAALEDMRDVAPLHIFIGDADSNTEFDAARARVSQEMPHFRAALERLEVRTLTAYAGQLATGWDELSLRTPSSDTLAPLDSVDAFINRVHDALSGTLYVSDLGVGDEVQVSETLLLYQDSLKNSRQSAGVLRALSRYSALRSGYLASQDAARLDSAWWALEQELTVLANQVSLNVERRPAVFPADAMAMEPVDDWMAFVEREVVMADVITLTGDQARDQARDAMRHLRNVATVLLQGSVRLADEARVSRLTRDSLLALGLLVLYMLVAGFGLLFYRSRYGFLQAQAENEAKSQFLARMSHEIRTPLNGVIGLAELLSETSVDAKQRNYVELIESAGRTLLGLVNDILDYSRIEAGKLQLGEAAFELEPFLAETAQMFNLPAQDNNNLLVYHLEPGAPQRICGDAPRLRQVLINLIGNAVKFTENGHVYLAVRALSSGDGTCRLRFEVVDSGIGLSEMEQGNLFGVFSQASPDVGRRYGGSGLGLSISRELVRLMGGDISVSSAPGLGSRFWFDLDLQLPSPEQAGPTPALTGRLCLLDPDDQVNWTLHTLGYRAPQVQRFANVEELVAACSVAGDDDGVSVLVHASSPDHALLEAMRAIREALPAVTMMLLSGVRHPVEDALASSLNLHSHLAASVMSARALLDFANGAGQAQMTVAAAPDSEPQLAADLSGLQVLVAEDNPVNQMVTAGYLKRLGVDADLVENGRQAVERYRDSGGQYDAILMDLDMPVLNGTAAARQVRQLELENGWQRCRIVALSAHVLPEYTVAVRQAGMDGQLVKPVGLADLADALSSSAAQ